MSPPPVSGNTISEVCLATHDAGSARPDNHSGSAGPPDGAVFLSPLGFFGIWSPAPMPHVTDIEGLKDPYPANCKKQATGFERLNCSDLRGTAG